MKKKSSLDQLDQWFASKGNSANNYFYIALLFVGLVAYFILSQQADPYLEKSETNLSTATTKLEGAQREYNEFFGGDPKAFVDNKRNILNGARTNIKIYAIHSDRREPSIKQIFQPEALLDIDVKFEGAFSNVLRYINLIEQSEMIVDVNKMDINATKNGKIGGSIGISIWGVNY